MSTEYLPVGFDLGQPESVFLETQDDVIYELRYIEWNPPRLNYPAPSGIGVKITDPEGDEVDDLVCLWIPWTNIRRIYQKQPVRHGEEMFG
jgi:hypothetical protein